MDQHEAFPPPKPWNPDRFRSVITSVTDHTIIDQEAIPWCTKHDHMAERTRDGNWLNECAFDPEFCMISTGGPDHKWWCDGSA